MGYSHANHYQRNIVTPYPSVDYHKVVNQVYRDCKSGPFFGELPWFGLHQKPEAVIDAYADLVVSGFYEQYGWEHLKSIFWGEYNSLYHALTYKGLKKRMIEVEKIPNLRNINNHDVINSNTLWDYFHIVGASYNAVDLKNWQGELPPVMYARSIFLFRK